MKCTHCGKEIILVPSAKERAAKYGGQPSDYTKLFTMHTDCQLELRAQGTSELIKRHYSDKGPPRAKVNKESW
jgi:hypothetical protein